jgi:hypothetical protein
LPRVTGHIDPSVRGRVGRYLSVVDAALPGLVEWIYLTGSAVLDDFRPGRSDIDLLVVTSRPVNDDDAGVLAQAHRTPSGEPHLDGVYLDRTELAAQPDDEPVRPQVVEGEWHHSRPCGELTPVGWLTLLRYGVAVRGPAVSALGLSPPDAARQREWNLANLGSYWAPLADRIRAAAGRLPADTPLDRGRTATTVWTVLGPARLHYTMAHDDVISKSAAGRYVVEHFPQWTALARRAVDWRAGGQVSFTAADALAAAALAAAVVADAQARWGNTQKPSS